MKFRKCPTELIDAAADDRLADDQVQRLQSHLSTCKTCCQRLESTTASSVWWNDASRLLDDSLLDDPSGDISDSSAADARLFEGDDPVGELKAAGVIDSGTHPEMLGQLGALRDRIGDWFGRHGRCLKKDSMRL